jgi:hypothetical protein
MRMRGQKLAKKLGILSLSIMSLATHDNTDRMYTPYLKDLLQRTFGDEVICSGTRK